MTTLASRTPEDVRRRVMEGEFISADQFLAICRNLKGPKGGPGCYVILVYGRAHIRKNLEKYAMGYIGQSVHVVSRLRNHLSGHGNERVYSDVRKGRRIMVQIIPCSAESLNDLERSLIAAFDRRKLYNRTSGGSKERCHDASEFLLADRRLSRPWTKADVRLCRAVFTYTDGPPSMMLTIDGVKTARLERGERVSLDLSEGRHRVSAKRLGLLTGRKRVKFREDSEVSVRGGRIRFSITSFRHAPYTGRSGSAARDPRSEDRLSCFYGEKEDL